MTPREQVLQIEQLRIKKRLSKTAVCRKAGIGNAIYSYLLNRGYSGEQLNAEQVRKILEAIRELKPDLEKAG